MSEKPTIHFGRGGRGLLLAEHLNNPPRRPGQVESSGEASAVSQSSADKPSQEKILQNLFPIGRARGLIRPTADVPQKPPILLGRGRALALATENLQRPPLTPPESPVTIASSDQADVETELEKLTIGKYSSKAGTPLALEVNYVNLKQKFNSGTYEYHVSFTPPVDSQRMKFRLISDAKVKEIIGSEKMFDGAKLYLPLKLQTSPQLITVQMLTDNSAVTVSIKLIKRSSAVDLIHLYNVLFRKVMRILEMVQIGRNYFNPRGGIPVPQHRLEVWPGYVTAVQEYEGGVMLNCDASFRVLRTITARDIMDGAVRHRGNMREEIMKALINCVVLTRYNNKTYRVDDIAWDKTPTSTFTNHKGEETSFVDYYWRSYEITIKDLKQPLLINKEKKKAGKENEEPKLICLIPELCFMTGLTDEMRNDFKVMKDIATHTRVAPEQRQFVLQKFVDTVNKNPEARKIFESWNLELDCNPLPLEGRLLNSEQLVFGGGVKVSAGPDADWGRQATSNKVLVPVHFENWALIYQKKDSARIQEFTRMLRNVCPQMGINVCEPTPMELLNDRTDTYLAAAREVIRSNLQIVVVVFPTSRDDRYSAVKKLTCIEMPIPSQAINLRTISDSRKLRSVVQKIALQMNCKLGGELWSVHIPIQNLMVCGMDTYHNTAGGNSSVLAFVASINQNRTRWFSMTTIQKRGQEVGDSLRILFLAALKKYHEVNHNLPDKIILYRDGVGDGQMDFVAKYEVEQLLASFKHFDANYAPSLSVVVVQKRINTRMYAVEGNRGHKSLKNPLPGSVLDHTVTRKKWYDFFLVSQHVRQGTVTPTHYVVIYDSSKMTPEHMQRVAYKMTHLYYNWPGTVRVPAPCQYAHKMAYLVGQNLHRDPHTALSDKLFFL